MCLEIHDLSMHRHAAFCAFILKCVPLRFGPTQAQQTRATSMPDMSHSQIRVTITCSPSCFSLLRLTRLTNTALIRMLKKSASFVLASIRGSTYDTEYGFASSLAAAAGRPF
jgi:hypothetical protein